MAGAVWTLGRLLEIWSIDMLAKIFWIKIQFLGISLTPFWLVFTLQYTGYEELLTRRNLAMLGILPLTTLFLAFTNENHGLIFSRLTMNTN